MKIAKLALVCMLLASTKVVLADDLYRCGNTYQDVPCQGVVSKPINAAPVRKPAITFHTAPATKKLTAAKDATTSLDADCKKRADSAKMIAKLREIGVSENDQLSITADARQKDLVKDVYSRSGSPFQVQNAVEMECLQQKQKTSLTSNWMTRAKRLLGIGAAPASTIANNHEKPQVAPNKKIVTNKPAPVQNVTAQQIPASVAPTSIAPATPAPAQPTETTPAAPNNAPPIQIEPTVLAAPTSSSPPTTSSAPTVPSIPSVQPEAMPKPAQKEAHEETEEDSQGICSALKAGVENITNQRRKGGSASLLNDLKQQQMRLESTMKSAGC
jgi:hypothetical protein